MIKVEKNVFKGALNKYSFSVISKKLKFYDIDRYYSKPRLCHSLWSCTTNMMKSIIQIETYGTQANLVHLCTVTSTLE